MTTPNTGIPYVPENTQDPAAGLNLALNVIDALLQTAVIDMGQTAPPGSPNDGDLHIVGTGATGAWAGQDNNLARYVAEGDFWQFFTAGVQVKLILNADDGGLYAWTGSSWAPAVAGTGSGTVTSIAVGTDSSVSDVLGTSGGPVTSSGTINVTAVDPGADRLLFWDDSESKLTYLTLGTNLSITGTTLNAAGGGGGAVDSVNGQTGVVQIDAEDVPYSNTTSGLAATNVQDAIDELAATPPGSTAWGAITGTLADQTDLQAALDAKASAVVNVSTPSNSSGTVTLDFAGKSKYVGAITLSANVTTLAFSNLPGPGKYAEYELHITQDGTGSRTFAIPANHKALGGSDTAIASAPNAVTVLTASTVDNGTTWRYAMQESA